MKSFLRCMALGLLLLAPAAASAQATFTLIGHVNPDHDQTCFHVKPNGSFNPDSVDVSTFTLQFNTGTIHALEGQVTARADCEGDEGDGDHGGGECDSTGQHDDAARLLRDDGHGGDGEAEGDDDDDCGIKACFSTSELLTLFGDLSGVGDHLAEATVHFNLNNGSEIVATFVAHGQRDLDVRVMPNPLNPRTVLTFTLSRPGRVQVAVYDVQGRLVNKLSDQVRSAGPQFLVWDGSNSRNGHVSSGVYFFRIQAPEGQVVQRVAVVK